MTTMAEMLESLNKKYAPKGVKFGAVMVTTWYHLALPDGTFKALHYGKRLENGDQLVTSRVFPSLEELKTECRAISKSQNAICRFEEVDEE